MPASRWHVTRDSSLGLTARARVRVGIHDFQTSASEVLNRVHVAQLCGLFGWQELATSVAFLASVRLGIGTWDVAFPRTLSLPSQAGGQCPGRCCCAGGAEAGWACSQRLRTCSSCFPRPGISGSPDLGHCVVPAFLPRVPSSCHSAWWWARRPWPVPSWGHPACAGGDSPVKTPLTCVARDR